jgi:hypothetical protein
MDTDKDFDDGNWMLNYPKIAESTNFAPVVRMLAIDLQKCPYLSVGDFLKNMSDIGLNELMELSGDKAEMDEKTLEQMMILTLMLSRAEGSEDFNMDETGRQVGVLRMLITCESLARKGLIRVFHENMTLGTDMGDKPVAEKL